MTTLGIHTHCFALSFNSSPKIMATLKIAMSNPDLARTGADVWHTFILLITDEALPSNIYAIVVSLMPTMSVGGDEDTQKKVAVIFKYLILTKYDILQDQLKQLYVTLHSSLLTFH